MLSIVGMYIYIWSCVVRLGFIILFLGGKKKLHETKVFVFFAMFFCLFVGFRV